jgi:predicted GIY-YIG superfamily endonuclease
MAIVYLIHFDAPLGNLANTRGQASHYIGYTGSLKRRLAEHRSGKGARIMAVLLEKGITWQLARTWSNGTRQIERQLKNRHNAPRLCPICRKKSED